MKPDLRQKWIVGTAAVLLIGGVAVTGMILKEEDENQLKPNSAITEVKASSVKTQSNAMPVLNAEYAQNGRNVTITYKVDNFKISGDQIDKAPVAGVGHLHLYVDGKHKALLKTNVPVKLENLSPGEHTIKLDLQNNNHTPLNVEKEFKITVK